MAPLVWIMGIPWSEAVTAGALMGTKTVLNELLAYIDLAKIPDDALSDRSRKPIVRRLFVRDLTPETHGNGIGIGNADFTTQRLVDAMDYEVTAINALTALSVQSVKIPIHFKTDREVLDRALDSLALKDRGSAKIMRIRDTLSLEKLQVSESTLKNSTKPPKLNVISDAQEMTFDQSGNLLPL